MSAVKEYFNHYESELTTASESFYAWRKIHNLAQHDKSIYSILNRNALSWNLILHSLQCTFFISLGRIISIDTNSLTINTLLEYCKKNIHEFSKAELKARKIAMSGNKEPGWLEGYMQSVYEPCENDFQVVQDEVSKQTDIYDNTYKRIRNKIYAHTDLKTIGLKNELFSKTNIDEIQNIFETLHAARMFLFGLIYNGIKHDLKDFKKIYDEKVCEDIEELLTTLKTISI